MTTPSKHLIDNPQNLKDKSLSNEGHSNTGDTSDEEDDDEYYTDSENQEGEVADGTVLQGSPETISTDGITALPSTFTEILRPDPDPKFESTPKKSVHESDEGNINTSTKGTPNAPGTFT